MPERLKIMLRLREARTGTPVIVRSEHNHPLPATLRGALSYGEHGTWFTVEYADGTVTAERDEHVSTR